MLWYMIWYDRYDMIWYDIYNMIWYDIYDLIWYIWYDIWYDMIWYDMIWYSIIYCVRLSVYIILFCHCTSNTTEYPLPKKI
jgi:hypothetical protein